VKSLEKEFRVEGEKNVSPYKVKCLGKGFRV